MKVTEIAFTGAPVTDMKRARAFYEGVLGFKPTMESAGGMFFEASDLSAVIPSLRLAIFGGLIIFFLVVEPEGLNRLWRNIRNYFRVWPFSY